MQSIRVEELVNVDREALFDVLSDHANYDQFRGVTRSELVRLGEHDRNGVGALRRLRLGPAVELDEEITAFESPNHFEYRITRARALPLKHRGGRVELFAIGANRTKVVWTSDFAIALPVIGGLVAKRLASEFAKGFRGTIHAAASIAVRQAA